MSYFNFCCALAYNIIVISIINNHNTMFERVSTDPNQELTVFVDYFLREMIDHSVGGLILTTTNLIYPDQAS